MCRVTVLAISKRTGDTSSRATRGPTVEACAFDRSQYDAYAERHPDLAAATTEIADRRLKTGQPGIGEAGAAPFN
jgi:hypothetical protein